MPFTLSHPAAVLPFVTRAAKYNATSALVIGSLIPDLPYFVRWPIALHGSHTPLGLATFCLTSRLFATPASRSTLYGVAAMSGAATAVFGIAQKMQWDGRVYGVFEATGHIFAAPQDLASPVDLTVGADGAI